MPFAIVTIGKTSYPWKFNRSQNHLKRHRDKNIKLGDQKMIFISSLFRKSLTIDSLWALLLTPLGQTLVQRGAYPENLLDLHVHLLIASLMQNLRWLAEGFANLLVHLTLLSLRGKWYASSGSVVFIRTLFGDIRSTLASLNKVFTS